MKVHRLPPQSDLPEGFHVAVSGASGLIGTALVAFLESGGYRVSRVGRPGAERSGGPAGLPGDCDAVVHLAGGNIAAGRWSAAAKEEILRSRMDGTRRLAEAAARLAHPPRVFLCASAVGYYGDRGDEELDESSPGGTGFLADVVRAWEDACAPVAERGIRVASLRFGVVLAAGGGALAKMLPAFALGAGGRIGSGRQWMSWIALDDVLGAVLFALTRPELRGPVNVVSPVAVQNAEFARTLGRVLRRPAVLPLPASVVRLVFGEMGEAILLAGQRVRPRKLLDAGFDFRHPRLEDALRYELGRGIRTDPY